MKAAIFDVDGTLLDSMPVWDDIASVYLKSIGIKTDGKDDYEIITMSIASACLHLISKYGIDKTVDEMIKGLSDMVADKYRYEIQLKSGVKEYLAKLKSEGVSMCVVTASERGYITDALVRLNIYNYFDFMLTCSEAGLDKNSAAIYDMAREKLGADTEDTVVFEDAFNAITAAKNGGYKVYAVYDKSMDDYKDRIILNCDKYIYDYAELM